MARCDEGYICDVCGRDVPDITQSDLYLRFVIGEVEGRALLRTPERHIRCNPIEAQFIVDDEFEPVHVAGDFSKTKLDPDFVAQREALLTRGWRRLRELIGTECPFNEYPLEEFRRTSARG